MKYFVYAFLFFLNSVNMAQTRRDWLRSSLGMGGLLMAPSTLLTSFEKERFNPRDLDPIVRLSSNENPYGPSKVVQKAILKAFDHACRYPYEYSDQLAVKLAKKHGVDPESIIITGGSTEGLKLTGLTFAHNGGEIISAAPTFLAMMDFAKQWGATVNWVDVDESKGYNLDEIENRIGINTKLIFLCNPNNPTGTVVEKNRLLDFCETASQKAIVFSDEAYYDFIEDPDYPSMDFLVRKGENVIVSKTFSKVYGLAGTRIGYLIAKPSIAAEIRKNLVAMSNVLAIAAAEAALEDQEFYHFSLKKTKESKMRIYDLLNYLGLAYVPSSTNFVFFESKRDIRELGPELLELGVRVGRPFPPFYDWCRISTGTDEEIDRFVNAMLKSYKA
ncbi:MAG: pyridoxal phosphate-dependent aminotransferase [Flavobacteriaceae bacterium]